MRLGCYNESTYARFFYFNDVHKRVMHQHITFSEFLSAAGVTVAGPCRILSLRNPYDRVYSGFLQMQRDIATQPSAPFPARPWIRELVMAQLDENRKLLIKAEYDFNKWILAIPEYAIFETGRNSNFPLHPSHYWVRAGRSSVG